MFGLQKYEGYFCSGGFSWSTLKFSKHGNFLLNFLFHKRGFKLTILTIKELRVGVYMEEQNLLCFHTETLLLENTFASGPFLEAVDINADRAVTIQNQ